ncbi:MAG: ATP-binding protein [Rubrivivax sp.]
MVGNLLDNACKWARSEVRVAAEARDQGRLPAVAITVDDDGPGIDARARERAPERGARLDETVPGSGLGLAIARDLAAPAKACSRSRCRSWAGCVPRWCCRAADR